MESQFLRLLLPSPAQRWASFISEVHCTHFAPLLSFSIQSFNFSQLPDIYKVKGKSYSTNLVGLIFQTLPSHISCKITYCGYARKLASNERWTFTNKFICRVTPLLLPLGRIMLMTSWRSSRRSLTPMLMTPRWNTSQSSPVTTLPHKLRLRWREHAKWCRENILNLVTIILSVFMSKSSTLGHILKHKLLQKHGE